MKGKNIELDVDFIGGQGSLTKAEEIAISNYIKAQKVKNSKKKAASKLKGKATLRKKAFA